MTWLRGDALNRDDVAAAARGCTVIIHAVNPPGYRRWSELVLPMLDNTIAAATAERATIVLPGTLYNYGPDAFGLVNETSPQNPLTRKGAIRVEMERRLESFLEMRYLWRVPLRMDNARLRAALGTEPHTPLDRAVEETLVGLRYCLLENRDLRSAPPAI